jgi:integrase
MAVTEPEADAEPSTQVFEGELFDTDSYPPTTPSAALVLADPHASALEALAPTIARAKEAAVNVRAPQTLASYKREWVAFERWCRAHTIQPLPVTPSALALYVAHLGTWRKPSGVNVAVAGIAWAHRCARAPSPHRDPVVLDQLEALRREKGTRPARKAPLTVDLLRRVVDAMGQDLEAVRDRAILLFGFAGGFRRSELVALDVADLTFSNEGVSVLLRKSKTDQHGAGITKPIPFGGSAETCPVRVLRAWLDIASIAEGPIFRRLDRAGRGKRLSGHAVAKIVKERAAAVGLSPKDLSGHSLRSGVATSAARAGKDVFEIMATTGHKKADTVAAYVREAKAFERNAVKGIL